MLALPGASGLRVAKKGHNYKPGLVVGMDFKHMQLPCVGQVDWGRLLGMLRQCDARARSACLRYEL